MDIDDILGLILVGIFILTSFLGQKKEKKKKSGIIGKIRAAIQESLEAEVEKKDGSPDAEGTVWKDLEGEPEPPAVEAEPKKKPPMPPMEPAPPKKVPEKKAPPAPAPGEGASPQRDSPQQIRARAALHTRLQRAVIWAEILDAPLALRNKGGGRRP